MTKMELLAIQGVADRLKLKAKEPKPDWMSEDMHRGKVDAYGQAEVEVRALIAAANEVT